YSFFPFVLTFPLFPYSLIYLPESSRIVLIRINRSIGVIEVDHLEDVILRFLLPGLNYQSVNIIASGPCDPSADGILAAVVCGDDRLRRAELRKQIFHVLRAEKNRRVGVIKIILIEIAQADLGRNLISRRGNELHHPARGLAALFARVITSLLSGD